MNARKMLVSLFALHYLLGNMQVESCDVKSENYDADLLLSDTLSIFSDEGCCQAMQIKSVACEIDYKKGCHDQEFIAIVAKARIAALDEAERQAQKNGTKLTKKNIAKINKSVRAKLYRQSGRGKATHAKHAASESGKASQQKALEKYRNTPKGKASQKRCKQKKYL